MNSFRSTPACGAAVLLLAVPAAQAGISMSPLTTFGGGDGWRAPNEILAADSAGSNDGTNYTWLGIANNERGMAYNPGFDKLVLVSRTGGTNIRQLDPLTGADAGAMGTAGVSGGTFAANIIACGTDGATYLANLTTDATISTRPFKIYKWADIGDPGPTEVFNNTITGFTGTPRLGDCFDAIDTASGPVFVTGGSGVTGYAVIKGVAATAVGTFTPAGIAAGDFRLGITFGKDGADHVWGRQTSGTAARRTSYVNAAGTYAGTLPLTNSQEAAMDVAVVGGRPLLATLEMNSTAPTVRVYDVTDPAAPVIGASGVTTSGTLTANSNGAGSIKWGKITAGAVNTTATLYAMSTNRGIQAFTVTVTPEITPPAIVTPPADRSVFERGVASFSVAASGTPPLSFQWLKDNEPIVGATASRLTISPVLATSAGAYHCRVSNAANPPAESTAATLTVVPSVNTTALTGCWQLSPGSRPYLTEGDTQRGLGYNPAKGRLYLATRSPAAGVQVLNAADGADIGALDVTGVSGGTYVINMAGVAGDGAIYACNLSGTADGSNFKIYQWPDDLPATPPAAVYTGNPIGTRIGDSFTVRGSGANTQCAAGANNTNQIVLFRPDPEQAGFFQAIPITIEGAANASFSLGIAFGAGNTVWGKSNGGGLTLASFTLDTTVTPPVATGALVATFGTGTVPVSGGAIGVDPVNGCLAHIHTGDSDNVRLYRIPVPFPDPPPATLELLDQEFFATDNANGNAVGTAVFGGDKLFALNANNGLACFTVSKPLPPSAPPVITDVTRTGNNVVFKLRGTIGKTYLIEKSTQLDPIATWTPDGTVTQAAVEETVTRVIPAATPRLYWRAREQ